MPEKIIIQSSFEKIGSFQQLNEPDKKLLQAALDAMEKAYAPYSKFKVGAAILMENGKIVTGNNQENAAYPSGLCAERVAIFQASSLYPESKIISVAVTAKPELKELISPATPCGACRQSMLEYEVKFVSPIRLIMGGSKGLIYISPSISNLLPLAFESKSL
jgi:cytidine deaminase